MAQTAPRGCGLFVPTGSIDRSRMARRAARRRRHRSRGHSMQYWLMKTEPSVFSIEDLARAPRSTTSWDGVRNFQARNMLRDQMKKGDQVFLYYSSTDVPGIVGVMEVTKEGHPDATAFEKKHDHYDAESGSEEPALVHGRCAFEGTLHAHHHARRITKTLGKRAERNDAAASGQSLVGDSGGAWITGSSFAHSSDPSLASMRASITLHVGLLVFLTSVRILRPRTNLSTGEPTWLKRKRRARRKLLRRSKALEIR